MPILGYTKNVVMTPVWLFYMMSTYVTLSLLVIHISAALTSQKVDIESYPVSTLVVQNTGYNQEKQKIPQISSFTK